MPTVGYYSGIGNRFLFPFSWLYGAGVTLRNKAFDWGWLRSVRIGIPVISVGNIVAGGVGKTPLVEHIAGYCAEKGRRVGIVSRGYGRATKGVVTVSDGMSLLTDAKGGGDENVQMARKFPGAVVVAAERRANAARVARGKGADVIIVDDGFQHRYLWRDLDIVILDSSVDVTKEWLLPVGRKREPFGNIRRCDVIALSHVRVGSDEPSWVREVRRASKPVVRFRHKVLGLRRGYDGAVVSLDEGSKGGVFAFSGIGRHERFLESVNEAGIRVEGDRRYPDHYFYREEDVRDIVARMNSVGATRCVTTEKDVTRMLAGSEGVKRFLREHAVFYLSVAVEILEGASLMYGKIDDCLNRKFV